MIQAEEESPLTLESLVIKYETQLSHLWTKQQSLCWQSSWESLARPCDTLEEFGKKMLALKLTRCYLRDARLPHLLLEDLEQVDSEEALKTLLNRLAMHQDGKIYKAYSEFYLTATSLCYLIEASQMSTDVSSTISQLLSSARKTSSILEHFDLQQTQSKLQLQQHQESFGQMFTQIDWIHSRLALVEGFLFSFAQFIASFQALGFYFFVFLFNLLATSTRRTSASKFYLWIGFGLVLLIDLTSPPSLVNLFPDDPLRFPLLLRRAYLVYAFLVIILAASLYRDLDWENHLLLQQLLKEVSRNRQSIYLQ